MCSLPKMANLPPNLMLHFVDYIRKKCTDIKKFIVLLHGGVMKKINDLE